MIFDTFMFHSEFELLECRLVELEKIPNLVHVAIEANVDHQDHPKPFHLSDNLERFAEWGDRLRVVKAKGLPPRTFDPDPWAREHAQREYAREGLTDAKPDDVVLHGDIDEIPTATVTRNVRPRGFVSFEQRGHFWSLRWHYPVPWYGTVAAHYGDIESFGAMRDMRNFARRVPNAGWHLSWLPNNGHTSSETALAKVGYYCHPEITDRIVTGIKHNRFLGEGIHVDGVRMERCEIDKTFPAWVQEGRAPESWLQ